MKYVYVLTSSDNDFYYEQFFISIVSLRLHNPQAYIVVLIDSKTKESLVGKRAGYESYISETIIITAPETFSQKEVSRWIKTSMKNYITGDFLYIDCDTVIAGNLDCEFPQSVNIGAVLDTHVPLSTHHLAPYFKGQDKKLGFYSSFNTELRYNGGVLFCRDTPQSEKFFSLWHSLWLFSKKNSIHQDMPALNQANSELGGIVQKLDDEWNCQITFNGLPFLADSKIIHCFATSIKLYNCPYIPASIPVLSYVKETGIISPYLME